VQVAGNLSLCQTETCGNHCEKGQCGEVEGDSCVCDLERNLCVTIACPGFCEDNADCTEQGQDNCVCFFGPGVNVTDVSIAGPAAPGSCGTCLPAGHECDASTECCGQLVCDLDTNLCVTVSCPGSCQDNADCTEQGADDCVCFFGVGVDVTDVSIEGLDGRCDTCLPNGQTCNASTECCGQLVCLNGRCQQKPQPKPKPKRDRRCHKHGQSCTGDNNCCGQGICFGGKCGEKDTHCDHDSECARGFVCVGGRDTGGHRRCRRRGRNVRRKKNRG
jgi:hypothetical protein